MKSASFTGHRPKKIFNSYSLENPRAKILADELLKVIEYMITKGNVKCFYSGGALGTDQLAFLCVHKLKQKYPEIKNILSVPYKQQDAKWKEQLEKAKVNNWTGTIKDLEKTLWRYNQIKKEADEIIYVDELEKYKPRGMEEEDIGKHSSAKLQLRNKHMVDNSDIVIAVFDGTEGGTFNCVKYAKKVNKKIITLDPNNEFKMKK